MNKLILKVWARSSDGQKNITIPKNSEIKEGDYVRVTKVEDE